MLNVENFTDKGYKRYDQQWSKNADYLLQKSVKDDVGIKYFINIWVYENYKEKWYREGIDKRTTFVPDVQFQSVTYPVMNVELLLDDVADIKEIEDTFESLWLSLGCPYYEKL